MAMEISNAYGGYANSYINTADNKKKTTESGAAKEAAETGGAIKKTAADELSYLSKKYGNYSFVAANYTKGMKYGSNSTTNVAISPQFLSKMASDPELEKEYEGYLADMQELDAQEDRLQAAKGWHVVARGWVIDKDGGISKWGIVQKDDKKSHLQTMSENAEKIRKQNEEKKQEKVKIEEKRQANREDNKKTIENSATKEVAEKGDATKKTAADELSYLSKKYSNYSFAAANYAKGMKYGSNSTTNIAISPQFLKKMADNPELEKEYESYFEGMQKLDQENIRTHEARGRRMVAQGWAIDKNGGISRWGISEPTNKRHYGQEMTDYANKIREQKLEKKREQEKLEEKRQANREEKEQLREKLDEAGKERFGDKWKGVAVIDKDDENAAVPKANQDNAQIAGLNMDIKA